MSKKKNCDMSSNYICTDKIRIMKTTYLQSVLCFM